MDFVNQATAAGMAEVDLGKLGAEKAADQSVKQFAQRMVDDHSKANEQLIKILADKKIEVPKELPADAASTKDQLSSLPVADFDLPLGKIHAQEGAFGIGFGDGDQIVARGTSQFENPAAFNGRRIKPEQLGNRCQPFGMAVRVGMTDVRNFVVGRDWGDGHVRGHGAGFR